MLPLIDWFEELWPLATTDARLARCAEVARRLLADQTAVVPLHGDLHHGNVLDFGGGDRRVIDPKRLVGVRVFDYANIFCNPDLDHPEPAIATRPEVVAARLDIVGSVPAWVGNGCLIGSSPGRACRGPGSSATAATWASTWWCLTWP